MLAKDPGIYRRTKHFSTHDSYVREVEMAAQYRHGPPMLRQVADTVNLAEERALGVLTSATGDAGRPC